ncbi:hypothetical protein EGW08_013316, partial [Elysia chlorotica]
IHDDLPGDELLHDLVAAAVDGLDASVGVCAADPVLLHVAPAPVKLDAAVSNLVLEVGRPGGGERDSVNSHPWFSHAEGSDTFPSSHSGDELVNLLLGAVVGDVRHHDVRVESPARPCAVGVAPGREMEH